jgi:5-methylcytosine-specific restriction endonuclease McrA
MASGDVPPFRKASPYCARLVESYCHTCGLLIAASPQRRVLAIMERLHRCPVYFRYPRRMSRASWGAELKTIFTSDEH